MYLSPVAYSSNTIPEKYQLLYSFNPLVGVIEGFRWCILQNKELNLISIIFAIVGLLLGIKFFGKFENTFADLI